MPKDLGLKKSSRADASLSINALPTEVLSHIFQLVLVPHTQPCFLERDKYSDYPNYPETLMGVCSRWRRVALASPPLWSRIDIVLTAPAGPKLLERAMTFIERAGQSPLDLRIFDQPIRSRKPYFCRSNDDFSNEDGYCDFDFEEDDSKASYESDEINAPFRVPPKPRKLNISKFFPSFPAHVPIESVELVVSSSSYTPILGHCFEKCLPGALTKLVLRVQADFGISYTIPLSEHSEAVWLSVTTLHLIGGIRPSWTSNAFKGLADLRLSGCGPIPESQFVSILRSGPKLRILQLHIGIGASVPLNTPVEPIHLDDLEVLDLIEYHQNGSHFEVLTRWIALGQKPLSLFLWCLFDSDSVKSFFRRANVTELHVRLEGNTTGSLEKLIDLVPRLRVLAVDGCGGSFNPKSPPNSSNPSRPITQIDSLHMQYCTTQFELLQRMVQTRSIRKLTMWSSHIRRGMYGGVSNEEICALCPDAKVLKRRDFTTIEDWIKSIA